MRLRRRTYRQCIRRARNLGERVGRVEAGHGGYTVVELNRFVPDAELECKVSAGLAARRGVAEHTPYRKSVSRKPAVSANGPIAPVVRIGGSLRPVCRQRKQKSPVNRSLRTAVARARVGLGGMSVHELSATAAGAPCKGRLLETRFSNNSSNSNNTNNPMEKYSIF